MVYGRERQDDLLRGRRDGVAIAVVVDLVVLVLQTQARVGVLCHVAEISLLHRAQQGALASAQVPCSARHGDRPGSALTHTHTHT